MNTNIKMDIMSVCRTCMSGTSLNPVFPLPEVHERFSNVIFLIAGIKVTKDDGLPQKMCLVCLKQVNDCMKFRARCKETEETLLRIKNEIEQTLENNNQVQYKVRINSSSEEDKRNNIENDELCEELKGTGIKTEYVSDEPISDEDDDKPLKYLADHHIQNKVENGLENGCNDDNSIGLKSIKAEAVSRNVEALGEAVTDGFVKINDSFKENNSDTNNTYAADTDTDNIEKFGNINVVKNQTIEETRDSLYEIDMSNPDGKRVTCKLCLKNLSIRSIEMHLTRSHPGADGRRVKCRFCDTFIIKEKMVRHRLQMHGSNAFQCRYCKWEFDQEDALIEHVATCTAKRKRAVWGRELTTCNVCQKVMQRASLRLHRDTKHAALRPICEHCGNSFGNKFRLHEHYRAKHGYEKFRCSRCHFQSASTMAMRNHERRHRGEKPFVCERCGAGFHAAYLLVQHRHSHRTDRKYKCEACGARFKANNGLLAHRRARHADAAT